MPAVLSGIGLGAYVLFSTDSEALQLDLACWFSLCMAGTCKGLHECLQVEHAVRGTLVTSPRIYFSGVDILDPAPQLRVLALHENAWVGILPLPLDFPTLG